MDNELRDRLAKSHDGEWDETAETFQGRSTALRRIAAWLDSDRPGTLVVTGLPGCGKSAVLRRIVTLADPVAPDSPVKAGAPTPLRDGYPNRRIDAAVDLTGMTFADTVVCLTEALSGSPGPDGDLEVLAAAIESLPTPLTVVVDALDEARDPLAIAGSLLHPLAATGHVKLLVGTRPSTRERSDQSAASRQELIDALGGGSDTEVLTLADEVDAVERYAEERLIASTGSPFEGNSRRTAELARRIALQGRTFLFARLAVMELLARPYCDDAEVANMLGGGHRRLVAMAVERFAAASDTAVPLLRALAYALGRGLPREDGVWTTVANALHPSQSFSDAHIDNVLALAGPYIAHDSDGVHRLAQRSYVEHFQAEGDARQRHRAITEALLRQGQVGGWSDANEYLIGYIAAHARLGDTLERVLDKDDLLDRHDQDRLADELQSRYFGAGDLDPTAGAILRFRGELRDAAPADRPALRYLARLLNDPDTSRRRPPTADKPAWWPLWARSATALHLRLGRDPGAVTSVFGTLADGRVVLACAAGESIRLWDPDTRRPLGAPMTGHSGAVSSVAFGTLPDGRVILASAAADHTVRLWDPATGRPLGAPLTGHSGWVTSVTFGTLGDGRVILASAAHDTTVRLWDPATGRLLGAPLTGHTGQVYSVAFGTLGDGRVILASAAHDTTVRLWDPATGRLLGAPLTGHTSFLSTVAFGTLADGRVVLASAAADDTVRLWDPATGQSLGPPLTGHTEWVRTLAFGTLRSGRVVLASAGDDATLRLWNPAIGRPLGPPLTGHTGRVYSVAFGTLTDGRVVLASAADDDTVRLWDPASQLRGALVSGHSGLVNSLAFATLADGRDVLASGAEDATVRLWDPATGFAFGRPLTGHADAGFRLGLPFSGSSGAVSCVAFGTLADGRVVLASAGHDTTIRVWDPATGERLGAPLTGHTSWVSSVAFGTMADRRVVLASSSYDNTVRIWDLAMGQTLDQTQVGPVFAVAFGRLVDGRVALAHGFDKMVGLWDLVTGEPIGSPLIGHTGSVSSLAFGTLPDGAVTLASGSFDNTVRLWDTATGRPVCPPLTGHAGHVNSVAFGTLADGQVVLASAAHKDHRVRLWDPVTGRLLGEASLPMSTPALVLATSNPGGSIIAIVALGSDVAAVDIGVDPQTRSPRVPAAWANR